MPPSCSPLPALNRILESWSRTHTPPYRVPGRRCAWCEPRKAPKPLASQGMRNAAPWRSCRIAVAAPTLASVPWPGPAPLLYNAPAGLGPRPAPSPSDHVPFSLSTVVVCRPYSLLSFIPFVPCRPRVGLVTHPICRHQLSPTTPFQRLFLLHSDGLRPSPPPFSTLRFSNAPAETPSLFDDNRLLLHDCSSC